MIFSPLLVVAVATCLPTSTSASPFLVTRQETANSSAVTDPHAAPSVPLNWTSPLANGGVGWKDAFAKASAIVGQMTVEEKVNISSGYVRPQPSCLVLETVFDWIFWNFPASLDPARSCCRLPTIALSP